MKKETVKLIAARISDSKRMAVTSHQRPDGDSLYSALALKSIGEQLGIKVELINADRTPLPFSQYPEASLIKIGQIEPSEFDTVILLECADISRSGQNNLNNVFKINIDHHHSHTNYADLNWVDPDAAAVGEMVYLLCRELKIQCSPDIAEKLFCAIASDTGSFQFSNTTERALKICSELIGVGANPVRAAEKLFGNQPPEKVTLLGRVLSRLWMNEKGNIAVISMFKSDLETLNLKEIDTEEITTIARSIKNISLVVFFKEMAPDTFRVSLRSKGTANAALIAEKFGGGGHMHASGFTVFGPYEKLFAEVPKKIEALLEK